MIYVITNSLATLFFYLYSRYYYSVGARCFFSIICVFLISLLPAFQYGVGTDYFSYQNIYNNQDVLDVFLYKNKEFLFYLYVTLFRYLDFDFYDFIIATAFLQSIAIFFIINKFWRGYGYSVVIVFFLFWTITNLMHTQMNLIRASFAIYFFAMAIMFKFKGRLVLCFLFSLISIGFHRSALISFAFIFLPCRFYLFLYKHILFVYVFSFFTFITTWLHQLIFFSVDVIFPYYNHYLYSFNMVPYTLSNMLTKMYLIPSSLLFIFFIKYKLKIVSNHEKYLIGLWGVTSNMYLLMINFDFFSRINYYFVLFYIMPLLYIYKWCCINNRVIFLFAFILYCLIPYIIKVVIFPMAEFRYITYIF